jgi:hypothetical protein
MSALDIGLADFLLTEKGDVSACSRVPRSVIRSVTEGCVTITNYGLGLRWGGGLGRPMITSSPRFSLIKRISWPYSMIWIRLCRTA